MKPSSGLEPETPSLPCDAIDERMGATERPVHTLDRG